MSRAISKWYDSSCSETLARRCIRLDVQQRPDMKIQKPSGFYRGSRGQSRNMKQRQGSLQQAIVSQMLARGFHQVQESPVIVQHQGFACNLHSREYYWAVMQTRIDCSHWLLTLGLFCVRMRTESLQKAPNYSQDQYRMAQGGPDRYPVSA